jgi:hypothetical protein
MKGQLPVQEPALLGKPIQVLEITAHMLFTTYVLLEQLLVEDAMYQAAAVLDPIQEALQEQIVRILQGTLALVEELLAEAHVAALPLLPILAPAVRSVGAPQPAVEHILTAAQALLARLLLGILILIAMELKLFQAAALPTP